MALEGNTSQIQDFVRVIKRRRWQIFLPALFILVLGTAFAVIVPKKYIVETRIEIRESRNEADYQLRNPQEAAASREIYNAEQHIRHFLRIKTIVQADQYLWPEYVKAGEAGRNTIIRSIIEDIDVGLVEKDRTQGSSFVDISYKDVDSKRAEVFLTRLTKAWVEDVVERDLTRLKNEREVLQEQVYEWQDYFREADQKFISLATKLGVNPATWTDGSPNSGRQRDWHFEQLGTWRTQQVDMQGEVQVGIVSLDNLRKRHEEEPNETVTLQLEEGINFVQQIAQLNAQILELRELQKRYKPAHSKWRLIATQVEGLEDQIRNAQILERDGRYLEAPIPNPIKQDLAERIREDEADLSQKREQLKLIDERVADLERQTEQRIENFRHLRELSEDRRRVRLELDETSKELADKEQALKTARDAHGQPFDIATPPSWADAPLDPNPWLIVIFCLIFGIAVGLVLALGLEYGRNAYRNSGDLSETMSIPVLGAVASIVTQEEARRTHMSRAIVGVSTAVLLGSVLWMTWVWYADKTKLPVVVQRAIEDFQRMLM